MSELTDMLPYFVETGYQLQVTTHFRDFPTALEFLVDHLDDLQEPRLLGAGFDAESDGLTPDEHEAVFLALDMRKPRARRA